MIIPGIGIVTTGTVAFARIDVLQVHAAELYVAPAIGQFCDCKCWLNQAESSFFGQWADVERAHVMLAEIRSAMDEAFAEFFEAGTGGGNPKALAANFSKGMGLRISQRLRRLKVGRPAAVLAKGKDLVAAFAKRFPGASSTGTRPSISAIAYAAGVGVIRKGVELGVPLELTLSCMQPKDGLHCGRCSKCRERRDAFHEAGVADPTAYRQAPPR